MKALTPKQLNRDFRQKEIRRKIIETLLSDGPKSIADLERIMNENKDTSMKRSTLNYYLEKLKTEGIIETERIEEKITGRPTMINLKENVRNNIKKEQGKERRYMIEYMKILKKNKGMDRFDFYNLAPFNPEDKDFLVKSGALSGLMFSTPALIKHTITLTKEGKEFLEKYGS